MHGRKGSDTPLDTSQSDEERIRLLKSKISSLRDISIEIGNEVNEHNQYLDTMHDSFSLSGNLLRSAMRKVTELSHMNAGGFLFTFLLAAFLIFIFVHFCF